MSQIAAFHSLRADFASGFSGFAFDVVGFGQLNAARAFAFVACGSWFGSSCAYLAAAATLFAAGAFDVGPFAFKDGTFACQGGTFAFFYEA